MASIRKLSGDKGKKNKPYYIQYFDHEGKRVTVKGFTDRPTRWRESRPGLPFLKDVPPQQNS